MEKTMTEDKEQYILNTSSLAKIGQLVHVWIFMFIP